MIAFHAMNFYALRFGYYYHSRETRASSKVDPSAGQRRVTEQLCAIRQMARPDLRKSFP
jgi:hypothetical protein